MAIPAAQTQKVWGAADPGRWRESTPCAACPQVAGVGVCGAGHDHATAPAAGHTQRGQSSRRGGRPKRASE